jgi:eukaryotic-like serine/threonine-protein kinase
VEDEKTGLFLGSLDSKESFFLLPSKSNAVFALPGYLLFVREQSLMAQAFDAGSGKMTSQAFPITENVGYDPNYSVGFFSASTNGVIALGMSSNSTGNRHLIWFDRNGKRLGEVGSAANQFDFSPSPDEKRVAIRRFDPQTRNQDLWLIDLLRQTESRFTFRPAIDDDPVWSPDGSKIYFDSNPDGIPNIHRKPASGVGSEELLSQSSVSSIPVDCSPDGHYLLFVNTDPRTYEDLWILPLTSEQKPYPYLQSDASEISGMFSPDGRWIAYASNESGKNEVYVQAFPSKQGKWQVSIGGGAHPVWNKSGKEIFYLAPDKKLMTVDVKSTGTSFEQGIPKPLFTTDVDSYVSINRFVVSKDGKQFLINTSVEGTNTKPIMVILNWTAEVKKK